MTRVFALAALAFACVIAPAFAAEEATGNAIVTVPWGAYLGDALVAVCTAAVPIVATFLAKGIQQVAPWAMLVLSQRRIEDLVVNSMNFGLNAVVGATKDKTVSVNLGYEVIAQAVKYALDHAPAAVIAEAGGLEGIAHKVFRLMNLEEGATVDNTLTPAIAAVKRRVGA